MRGLYTIGYEGAALGDFIATLQLKRIDLLLDVRELPISRRKGFAKTALRNALYAGGIQYRHEKSLGSPKPLRHALKRDWDYEAFFRGYAEHLASQSDLMEELARALKGNVALMCYERDYRECHRSVIAAELATLTGVKPSHLGVQKNEQRNARQGAHLDSRQSLSAA